MKKGRYKNLFSNMALFTIGNFVSKLLVMLLVPFYTNVLTTTEYGIADGMQATLLLLVPLLTINIGEAALRFGLEKNSDRSAISRIMLKYLGLADLAALVLCVIAAAVMHSDPLWMRLIICFFFLFACNSLYEAMILYCQGCEQVKVMIIGSISCTFLVIVSNLYTLLVLRIGLYGYLISQMISFLGAALIMLTALRLVGKKSDSGAVKNSALQEGGTDEQNASREGTAVRQDMDHAVSERKLLEKNMTGYGKSMLLYSTSSWVNNALDRYFVLGMCGAAANGLYGVAYKIPAILLVFQRIFAQAWQISANKNYEDEDSSQFFSQVYMGYQTVMTVGCSGLIMVVQIVAYLLFAKDFYYAWTMVPPLLISVIFGALTGFLGSICLAYKDGKSMGRATGIGALVNIVLNYIGISLIGPMGAGVATMISYFTMYAFAYRAVAGHVKLDVNRKRDFVAYALLLVQAGVIMIEMPYYYVVEVICFAAIAVMYGRRFYAIVMQKLHR